MDQWTAALTTMAVVLGTGAGLGKLMGSRIRDLKEAMDVRFQERSVATNARFDAMGNRLDAVDARLDAVDARLDSMENRFAQQFDDMGKRLDEMSKRMDDRRSAELIEGIRQSFGSAT